MTTAWKYTDSSKLVVFRTFNSGAVESILARLLSAAELATVLPPDPPPPPTQDELDTVAARQYQKAQALFAMSPAQMSAWIDANINTFADAKDALKTLAIIVSVLGRRL